LASRDAQIALLQAQLDALGGSSSSSSSGGDSDDVYLDLKGPATFEFDSSGPDIQSWNLLMEVVNETSKDIKDIELEIVMYPQWLSVLDIEAVAIASGSPDFSWQIYEQGGAIIVVASDPTWGDSLEVEAGDDENVFLTINVDAATMPASDVRFEVETDVTDFKYIN
jgi:ABC-type glycerol-3-phosphate transport system substrate-binding protein